ncbi:hypothetical protein QVD17_02664 [Tagetes erecta]|uniref:Leucine-rich repeat-containing protein n=1 Tax=Tagetes erecta TaxID=13708 RepID=A0AAD8L715_TARER|nr:hypothetical protein QVD17_02664 [Tagetes erecta]
MENDQIEAIAYNGYSHGRDISLRFCKIVSNMKKLRWLKVRMRDGKYVEGPNFLSNELRYIDWSGYPTSELPHNFILMKLVVLKLWGSLQKEVRGFKLLPHLKVLQLFDMEELQKTPNFDDLPCLQKLTLAYCYKLPWIHSSLGYHRSIEYIRVWKCPKLRMFPDIIHMKNLKTLDIANCGLGDGGIPDSIDKLSNLQELDLSGNKVSRLYLNLSQLRQLRLLNVSDCRDLHTLPDLPSSLITLKADSCYSLTSFGDGYKNCKRLCQVSLIQGSIINDGERLLQYMLEGKAIENGSMVLRLEGVEVAKGFNPRLLRGGRYILQLPGNWCNDFCGFLVCAVIKSEYNVSSPSLAISINQMMSSKMYSQDEMVWEESSNDGAWTWVGYVSFGSLKNTTWWDQTYKALEFNVEQLQYKKCRGFGVTLVEKKSITGTSKGSEGYTNNFKIEHDLKSALMISLIVYHPVYRCNMNAAT